jgi:hypothetical protein
VAKAKAKSSRDDGRGHWPAGKRRHVDAGDWQQTLSELRAIGEPPRRRGISQRAMADDMALSRKTIWRWLAGIDLPDAATQKAVRAWLAKRRPRA